MSTGRFQFASGNLAKVLAIPKYVLSRIFAVFVPRAKHHWAFGSGIGVGEGALALAQRLVAEDPEARIVWLVADDSEAALAAEHGLTPVQRRGWRGFWATLRARTLVVTHGLGDVNRFGVFGGTVVQLWHGAPLKRIHLDSPVTTAVRGPAPVRAVLRRMYASGARQVDLYVAGSVDAAERLRSAFRVDPGKVRVLGDPRDDAVARQATDPTLALAARDAVTAALATAGAPSVSDSERLVLYAPTWRDGASDAAIPDGEALAALRDALTSAGARLVIRSHPLGAGDYAHALGDRVHALGSDAVRDITPLLGGFDAVITDYSSIAVDYALLGRPILWFAPDLDDYARSRGLYEPLEVTAGTHIDRDWGSVAARLPAVLDGETAEHREAARAARVLGARFHQHRDGDSAGRVLADARRLLLPSRELVPEHAVFFESFYGRQVSCNPLAIDAEIAARHPLVPRLWSVTSERQAVPDGAIPLLVGGREWFAARRLARLLVVNDWLRYGFRRAKGQLVLQTWHGTMLKHLALGRPGVSLRTRLAIHRESRRWSVMLSQNPHSTEQFRGSYAFRGEILETGYPRDDRLALADLGGGQRNPVAVATARQALGVPAGARVLAYAPTWRDRGSTVVDELDVNALAAELGDDWVVVARGHTRTHAFGGYRLGDPRVIDASGHPDVNDVILAADLVVTDYSSLMFDAAVARVPLAFFVPDLETYRDRERGFTFDFEREAPGPLVRTREELLALALALPGQGDLDHALSGSAPDAGAVADWVAEYAPAYEAWRARFTPHDDGGAAARVVDRLAELGALPDGRGR